MHSLPLFFRLKDQPVILLGDGEAAEAKRRLLERAGARICQDEEAEARIAFVALDEPEAAAARLKARGMLVNVVDRPALCDFTTPSLLERGPVIVAVGTGGVSAGLAKALRMRLEALLPQSLGALAEALGDARGRMRSRWSDGADRRRALDAALDAGGPLDPLDEASAARIDRWLDHGGVGETGLAEFTACSDDPDDLTLRQARWLASADLVAHEPGVSEAILIRARADAARVEIGTGEALPEQPGRTVVIRRG